MPNQLPTITDEQRKEYLAKALEARRATSDLRKELKEGKLTLEEAFDDPRAQRMRVRSLLMSLPGVGEVKAGQMMARAQVHEKRRVKGCGHTQRAKLVELAEGMR